VEFVVNAGDVGPDGAQGNAEAVGDFFVQEALVQEVEDFLLASGELLELGVSLGRALEGDDDLAGDGAGHGRAALVQFLDGLEQPGRRGLFEQITAGPRPQRLENAVVILKDGEHHDAGGGQRGFQPPNALDAGDAGEVDVHQHDIGRQGREPLEGGFAGGEGANAGKAGGTSEQVEEGLSLIGAVLDEGDFDGLSVHGRGFTRAYESRQGKSYKVRTDPSLWLCLAS